MTNYEYLKAAIDNPGDDCIVWRLGKNGKYGKVWVNGKDLGAHAVALALKIPRPIGKVCSIKCNWVPGHKLEAAHGSCHNPLCFNPRHLSWKTRAENENDKKRDGTHLFGERSGVCTIPTEVRDAILAEYKGPQHNMRPKTGPTTRELADKYECSLPHVGAILNGHKRSVA